MNAVVADHQPLTFVGEVAHLARFDLRRFRLFVALIVGLEIVRATVTEWALHRAPAITGSSFQGVFDSAEAAIVGLIMGLATTIATAAIVQADLPSDDRAFWRTRPIAPLALATAKLLLFVVVFAVVPSVINAVRLLAYGAPVASIVAASGQILVAAGGTVAPAWGLALATRTLPRFLVAFAILIVGMFGGMSALLFWTMSRTGDFGRLGVGGLGFEWQGSGSATWMTASVTTLAIAILVAHYRLRRRFAATLAALGVVAVGQFLPPVPDPPVASADLARLVVDRLRVPSALGLPSFWSQQAATGWPVYLTGRVDGPALPFDVSAAITVRHPGVELDGRTSEARALPQCCLGRGPGAIVGATDTEANKQPAPNEVLFLSMPFDRFRGIAGRRASLRADADVSFARHRHVASLPFRPGAAFRTERYLLEIVALEPARRVLEIRFVRFPRFGGGETEGLSFFVADRGRQRVITATPATPVGPVWAASGAQDWAQGRTWSVRFQVFLGGNAPLPADAEVLVVETWPAGVAHTTLSGDVQFPRVD
jgi:hypothetical protein